MAILSDTQLSDLQTLLNPNAEIRQDDKTGLVTVIENKTVAQLIREKIVIGIKNDANAMIVSGERPFRALESGVESSKLNAKTDSDAPDARSVTYVIDNADRFIDSRVQMRAESLADNLLQTPTLSKIKIEESLGAVTLSEGRNASLSKALYRTLSDDISSTRLGNKYSLKSAFGTEYIPDATSSLDGYKRAETVINDTFPEKYAGRVKEALKSEVATYAENVAEFPLDATSIANRLEVIDTINPKAKQQFLYNLEEKITASAIAQIRKDPTTDTAMAQLERIGQLGLPYDSVNTITTNIDRRIDFELERANTRLTATHEKLSRIGSNSLKSDAFERDYTTADSRRELAADVRNLLVGKDALQSAVFTAPIVTVDKNGNTTISPKNTQNIIADVKRSGGVPTQESADSKPYTPENFKRALLEQYVYPALAKNNGIPNEQLAESVDRSISYAMKNQVGEYPFSDSTIKMAQGFGRDLLEESRQSQRKEAERESKEAANQAEILQKSSAAIDTVIPEPELKTAPTPPAEARTWTGFAQAMITDPVSTVKELIFGPTDGQMAQGDARVVKSQTAERGNGKSTGRTER